MDEQMLKDNDLFVLSIICILSLILSIVLNYPFSFPDGCDGVAYYNSMNGLNILDKHPLMVAFFPLARLFDMTTFIILLEAIPAAIFYSMIWMTSRNKWLLAACMLGHMMFNPATAEMMALNAFMFAIAMKDRFIGLLGFAASAGLHRFGFAFTAIYAIAEHIREEWPSWIKPMLAVILCSYFFKAYWVSHGMIQGTYYEFPSFSVFCLFPIWFAISNLEKKEHVSMMALLILLSLPALMLYYMGTQDYSGMNTNLYNEYYRTVVYAGVPLSFFLLANEGKKKYKNRIILVSFIMGAVSAVIFGMLPKELFFGYPGECAIVGTFAITALYLSIKKADWMLDWKSFL